MKRIDLILAALAFILACVLVLVWRAGCDPLVNLQHTPAYFKCLMER